MTPQELKASILQLAIQGKLVEQCPQEGTGEELFQQIQVEKQALIKAGKIKKEKPLPEIQEDEIPFEIPNSWVWIRLGTIVKSISAGGDKPKIFSKSRTAECSVPVISNGETNKGIFGYTDKAEITERSLTVSGRGTIGYAEIRTEPYVPIVRLLVITPLGHTYLEYIKIAIQASTEYGVGSAVKQLTVPMLVPKLIPLPPLAEQKRIVAKITELMPYIDRYEQAWNKLEDFNTRFPVEMQKSILQMAIQGKLVEQRHEEGTGEELFQQIQVEKQALIKAGKIKKEKPLPEITEDELPFDIPENWRWVRWGDLSQSIQYGYNAPAQEKGRIKMVRISDIQDGKVLWDTVPYCDIKEDDIPTYLLGANDILFARTGGTVGKSYLVKEVPEEAIYAGYLIRTQYSSLLCPEYMKYFMESQLYWDQLRNGTIATAQPNCNGKTLSKMILPLPPLAEQKRIVAKLEEILPLCEKLK
ncbi:MAG: restriction endonuclease subunit S [Clostridia bacterium]|nr:restriction endonuclease subunit S [Clostridia bacterium]